MGVMPPFAYNGTAGGSVYGGVRENAIIVSVDFRGFSQDGTRVPRLSSVSVSDRIRRPRG